MNYPINKPFLPNFAAYQAQLESIYQRNWLTNNGPCVQALEQQLTDYLGVEYLLLVSNGTVALQLAYAALGIQGAVLTTPFSFAATASTLCWEKLTPQFIDIDASTYNLDVSLITAEQAAKASAILGVHVFGNPCDVIAIDEFAEQNQLKVIYDAAHAFASPVGDKSALCFGDAATLSLHATKLFHSVEGGAIIFKDKATYLKAKQMVNFGFDAEQFPEYVGINAKMSEVHAAMGLCVLNEFEQVLTHRQTLVQEYQRLLSGVVQLQQWHADGLNNGAYMPVVLPSEMELQRVSATLLERGIQTRRYFYPSLSQVPAYGQCGVTPVANDISKRILCLPLYTDLTLDGVREICDALTTILAEGNR
ncbi:hypothetical protein PULV_a3396 [Pseudoalteromonas ulvae UL12]|uniref:DegT/DnrJ/EryC1/StrS family aminotransferase n=1 Tax=Pseudoalteromonas ulvae TaxID=107327 RepID=UPI00186B6A2D|nr:DegT/DnrJ/EryC1/StrS family aminotransferase [Pseudoalteromonas ulvae]MBE0365084.1 hypothetical protein [Pseudoalteromonas ulvae UL12]